MTERCIDHLNFINEVCLDCGLEVDAHGNTEDQMDWCAFPDCGCDGARLCMAGEASPLANGINVEGMYQRKDPEAVEARMALAHFVHHREEKS